MDVLMFLLFMLQIMAGVIFCAFLFVGLLVLIFGALTDDTYQQFEEKETDRGTEPPR